MALFTVEKRVYITNYYEDFNPTTKDVEHICNNRVPPHVLRDLPQFFVFDRLKTGEFGAETLLWDVVQLIEKRQKEAGASAIAKGTMK